MSTISNSRNDVLNKKQRSITEIYYEFLNMQAGINIGLERKTQEDSVLITSHPANNDFKLLAVADGMGGCSNGAEASNIALIELIKWFELQNSNSYYKELEMYNEINYMLSCIDETIRKKCFDGGTTLAFAITTNSNTIFINIGDSRIYTLKDQKLSQISSDQSVCWEMFKSGEIKEKDDIRFHKKNNLILSRLGGKIKRLEIETEYLHNSEYDGIYIFSDGITDCLSDKIIEHTLSSDISIKPLFEVLLRTKSVNYSLNPVNYYNEIMPAKDNATTATLIKKKVF